MVMMRMMTDENEDSNNSSQIFPEATSLWAMPHLILPQPYVGPVLISIYR